MQELKIYGIACSVVDSVSSLEFDGAQASSVETDSRNVLSQLKSILSSYRSNNNALVEKINERLAKMHNSAVSLKEQHEKNPRENANTGHQSNSSTIRLSNTQSGQNDDDGMDLSPSYIPNLSNNNFQAAHHQHAMSIDWDSIAEQTEMNFGCDIEQSDQSAAFDRFLMGDSVRMATEL